VAKTTKLKLEGTPESWLCVDCGVNTAPGMFGRGELEWAFEVAEAKGEKVVNRITPGSEIYTVRDEVWKAAGMKPMGGCLCIGCLEKRLGRELRPKDFPSDRNFNRPDLPGTERLKERRKSQWQPRTSLGNVNGDKSDDRIENLREARP
jgi:hypothetical protein